jgi:phage baseplate assembly protein W
MIGMDRRAGRAVAGDAHLAQSLGDLLSTPKGSRVMRRAYGCDLMGLIDAPINPARSVDVVMAVAEAVAAWEPRIRLTRVEIGDAAPGRLAVTLHGVVEGRETATGVVIGGPA